MNEMQANLYPTDRHAEADPAQALEIRSAVHSNYAGMMAMIGADNCVYLGQSSNYDDAGHYDNRDGSLCFITENTDMYYWLYGRGWPRSQEDMLQYGLTMDQYLEFARLQAGVLSQYEQQRAILFNGQYFRPPENYLLAAELTEEGQRNNYNQINGILDNLPAPRADLTDGQTHAEIAELAPETLDRPSVLERLNITRPERESSRPEPERSL